MKEGEALAMFVDELGATMSITVNRSTSYTSTRRWVAQAIANDTSPTAGVNPDGYPIIPYSFPTYNRQPVAAKLAIIWDRPTPASAGHRVFLRRALGGLGLDPSQVADLWAYPFALPSPPLETQLLEYQQATLEAIHASGAPYVCLLGASSVKLWRRELQVGQVMGKMGVLNSTWFVYVMPNPIVPLSDPLMMAGYRENLRTLVDIISTDSGMNELSVVCVEKGCREDDAIESRVFVYDPDGLPWCKVHWRKGFKRRLDHKARSAKLNNQDNQGRLV